MAAAALQPPLQRLYTLLLDAAPDGARYVDMPEEELTAANAEHYAQGRLYALVQQELLNPLRQAMNRLQSRAVRLPGDRARATLGEVAQQLRQIAQPPNADAAYRHLELDGMAVYDDRLGPAIDAVRAACLAASRELGRAETKGMSPSAGR